MRATLVFLLLALPRLAIGGDDAGQRVPAPPGTFATLAYHEVRDDVRNYPDSYAVDASALVAQFEWLRGNGYTPVSLDQIMAARHGGAPLPVRAVLLTFDDGYLSFYTRVYPLLREFHYPAVLAIVGSWIENPKSRALYGEAGSVAAAAFPSWEQLREMADSGLVELASHTWDMHHGVVANPQGNTEPAATSRIYDSATRTYENDADWRARVRADLARNISVIERKTGHKVRSTVWPYGSYNAELLRMAGELGSPIGLTLSDGSNTPDVPLTELRRTLVAHNPGLAGFITALRDPENPEPARVIRVDLAAVYSADPAQEERNLSLLLDRVQLLQPSHIYLQAYAGSGDGVAGAVYFPNRHLPVRADIFNRVAWQLQTRTGAAVFAVLPLHVPGLSDADLAEVYEDLARHAGFAGLYFDQPVMAGSADNGDDIALSLALAARVRNFRAPIATARPMTADDTTAAMLGNGSAVNFSRFMAAYDQVVITPTAAIASNQDIRRLALAVRTVIAPAGASGRAKIVYLLDGAQAGALASRMAELQRDKAINFGYAAGNATDDRPPLAVIAPGMSLRIYPAQAGR